MKASQNHLNFMTFSEYFPEERQNNQTELRGEFYQTQNFLIGWSFITPCGKS